MYDFCLFRFLKEKLTFYHEFAPGFSAKVVPKISRDNFFPYNEMAEKVTIVLEDGERYMDKFLFKTLYLVSKDTDLFSEGGDRHILPFRTEEFDAYYGFLLKGYERGMDERYPSYVKITNFLIPIDESLYDVGRVSYTLGLLGKLDLDLDHLPYFLVCEIISYCNIEKWAQRRDVVKFFVNNPAKLFQKSDRNVLFFILKSRDIIKEMGGDVDKMIEEWENYYRD